MKVIVLILSILLVLTSGFASAQELATGTADKNALYQHHSPYLAMHGRDPVRWQEWNAKTIAKAKKEGKLLFVSSGYFSCHWCHVMQRQSFQNDDIAKLLNTHFIPVKVDREIDAALDAKLIDFVERTQGIAGWPLNVFVTPDGYPLVGMVYAPPDNFKSILIKLNSEWQTRPAELSTMASDASRVLNPPKTGQSPVLPPQLAQQYREVFLQQTYLYADELQGGFGQENKFPSVPQLTTLLHLYQINPQDKRTYNFLVLTLNQMASLGLRDQLGGGFYRYVVDPSWHIPHFEKMLYDNALLASLYLEAGITLSNPAYVAIAKDTLDFTLEYLDTDTAGFAASLSAVDEKGIEGGYYLWSENQLKKLLSQREFNIVRHFWNVQGAPELDDGFHFIQTTSPKDIAKTYKLTEKEVTTSIESARKKLLKARQQRILPKDDKHIASWNGLTLHALAEYARYSAEPAYRNAAQQLKTYLMKQHWTDTTLYRTRPNNQDSVKGMLEDYAYVAQGLMSYWKLTNDKETQRQISKLLNSAWQRFYGKQGWQLAENMLLRYGTGETHVADSPLPSPSATLISVTLEFARLTNDEALEKHALTAMNVDHNTVKNEAYWHATIIRATLQAQQAKLE